MGAVHRAPCRGHAGCAVLIRYTLPKAPSDLTSGIAICEDANHEVRRQKGITAAVESDIADLWYYDGP